MEIVLKNFFQALAKNPTANQMAKKYGLRFGASRFVAGITIHDAVQSVRSLNRDGRVATLDHLGEFISTREEALESAKMCIETLEAIADSGIKSNLSLKMTSLGLDIDKQLCMDNMNQILECAQRYNNFVRIDMEDYAHCEVSIDIYRDLRKKFDNVGIVLQAYLYRTEQDVEDLNPYDANLRLVKGAYKESPKVAYPNKKDVDDNYKKLISQHLSNGNYTAVATHDEAIIQYVKEEAAQKGYALDRFEFQMLYGIAEDLQKSLVKEGYKVRVYVPYGRDWFGYNMRRLAERPANVWFVLKNLFK
ncbi:proline dehydrogenase [Paenibacillus urinalis]|uniref:proline dehydrogenase n=1 Tax=Paenibacillus urinalis TaxID=521520 RepID=A0AAX3N4Q3_9BACL|nr:MULTISPECIES: proline dehydrogenase [Paenibacillus]WDH84658.1 proline dehydrogenase [Paenibacillus urinalis]WDH96120.1 proline dehydrogenase [Paenibacillus urinalis]WDI04341.1 proline dehydrogenase [Paenibacillus urinalis]GAK38325.1 putative proline dehydrogenase [Paenibacillus sp. TCA20]